MTGRTIQSSLLARRREMMAGFVSDDSAKYLAMPLTIEAITGGKLNLVMLPDATDIPWVEYSINDGTWDVAECIDAETPVEIATLTPGDTVKFRHDAGAFPAQFSSGSGLTFNVYGNIMSLQYGSNFTGQTQLPSTSGTSALQPFGWGLFTETGVVDAYNLQLPATTLVNSIYASMFKNCVNLTHGPKTLPALTLTYECYRDMFNGCSSLLKTPEFQPTAVAESCCRSMFAQCTSLTQGPSILPALSLAGATECYRAMFYNCDNLITAPNLPATTLVKGCYYQMFRECENLVNVPSILPATTLAQECYYQMFVECSSMTTAPDLPATTYVTSCYTGMFRDCSSLNYIRCNTNQEMGQMGSWMRGVAATGTFAARSDASWTSGENGIPTGWTRIDY